MSHVGAPLALPASSRISNSESVLSQHSLASDMNVIENLKHEQQQQNPRLRCIFERLREHMKDGSLFEKLGGMDKQKLKRKKQRYAKTLKSAEKNTEAVFHPIITIDSYRARMHQDAQSQLLLHDKLNELTLAQQDSHSQCFPTNEHKQKQLLDPIPDCRSTSSHSSTSSQSSQCFDEDIHNIMNTKFDGRNEDSTTKVISAFFSYQEAQNPLNRIGNQEMELFQSNQLVAGAQQQQHSQEMLNPEQSSSSSSSFFFPFSNYVPSYRESDLLQLKCDSTSIDYPPTNSHSVSCSTMYADILVGFAFTNGTISVKRITDGMIFQVTHEQRGTERGSQSNLSAQQEQQQRMLDIVGLEFLPDMQTIISYHSRGAISLCNFLTNRILFYSENFFNYTPNELKEFRNSSKCILDLKVLSQDEKKHEIICVAVDALGSCVLCKIKRTFFSYEVDVSQLTRQEQFPYTSIVPLPQSMQSTHFNPSINNLSTTAIVGTESKRTTTTTRFAILALVSPQKLFIVRIKLPSMKAQAIFKFVEAQDSPAQNQKCSFTWAEMPSYISQNNQPQLYFLVSFTSSLYLSKLSKSTTTTATNLMEGSERKTKYQFDLRKRVRHYTSILFVTCLNLHLLLICDFNYRIFMIPIKDFERTAIRSFALNQLNSYKMTLPNSIEFLPIQYNLDSSQLKAIRQERKQFEKTTIPFRKKRKQQIFHNSVCYSSSRPTSCHILCTLSTSPSVTSQLLTISLVPWRDTLDNLIEQAQYYNACHFLHTIYKNHHKFAVNSFEDPDSFEDQLLNQIQRVAFNFCSRVLLGKHLDELPSVFFDSITEDHNLLHTEVSLESQHSYDTCPQELKPPLIFIMEFLLACKLQESIFDEIRNNCFNHLQSTDLFVECLQPLILNGKITILPNSILTDIIGYHEKKKRSMRMIQRILTSIDVTNLDASPLIQLMLSRQLIPAFVYLSTKQSTPDFGIPLFSFWQSFVTKLRKSQLNFLQKTLKLAQKRKEFPSERDTRMLLFVKEQQTLAQYSNIAKVKSEHFGLLAFWYFRICIQQRLVDGECITTERYKSLILQFFSAWLCQSENIAIALNRWPQIFFEVLNQFYSEKILQILNACVPQSTLISEKEKELLQQNIESISDFCRISRSPSPLEQLLHLVIIQFNKQDSHFALLESENDMAILQLSIAIDNEEDENEEDEGGELQQQLGISKNKNSIIDHNDTLQDSGTTSATVSTNSRLNLAKYVRTSYRISFSQSTDQISSKLRKRHKNLKSNFYLFLGQLIYHSQCRDDSSFFGGMFGFKSKKIIEIVFYLAQNHSILNRLEYTQSELLEGAKKYYSESYQNHLSLNSSQLQQSSHAHPHSHNPHNSHLHHSSNNNNNHNGMYHSSHQKNNNEKEQGEPPKYNCCDYLEISNVLRSEFMLSLVKLIYPLLTKQQSGELSQLLDATNFVTASSHVLLLRESYLRAIEAYLTSKNRTMSSLVFAWLHENLEQSKADDKQKFILLQDIVRKRLPDLIRINPEKTHQLFQTFLNGEVKDIISKLSNHQSLQLLYITNIIQQERQELLADPTYSDRIKVDTSMLILQIKLMCTLNEPEETILSELTSFDYYPMKEILSICLERQYMEVCSYIYLRMGQVDQAIRAQMRIFEQILREYKVYLEEFNPLTRMKNKSNVFTRANSIFDIVRESLPVLDSNNSELHNGSTSLFGEAGIQNEKQVIKFNHRMEDCANKLWGICEKNQFSDRPAQCWFLLLDLLVEQAKNFSEFSVSEIYAAVHEKFKDLFRKTIKTIAGAIPMDELIEKINSDSFEMNFEDLKSTFCELLNESIDANSIQIRSLMFTQEDLFETMQGAAITFLNGTNSSGICASCLDPLTSIDSIARKIMHSAVLESAKKSLVEHAESHTEHSSHSAINTAATGAASKISEDLSVPMIITFFCGHSYHRECYYRQKNIHICTECLKGRGQFLALMTKRKDVCFPELIAFILSQQNAFENTLCKTKEANDMEVREKSTSSFDVRTTSNDSGMNRTRNTTLFTTLANQQDEQAKAFRKLKIMQKLKNYDRYQLAKYAAIQPESKFSSKKKYKS